MGDTAEKEDVYNGSKPSKFRLKSKRRSKRRHESDGNDDDERDSKRRHRSRDHDRSRRSHRHSRRRHEHKSTKSVYDHTFERNGEYDDPEHRYRESLYDGLDGEGANSAEDPAGDHDQAFRESLFDALADDEGAAYWEGVYGQPVHVYSNSKEGPDGELERMNDDEYAEYVRGKMWEKSHQHILEERAARERARKKQKEDRQQWREGVDKEEAEREKIRQQMKESLERGEKRKRAREAEAAWETYTSKWDSLLKAKDLNLQDNALKVRELIPWPVVSGKSKYVSKEEIEYFFEMSPAWKDDASALLKVERVKWHPDRMQRRFGQHIDPDTMKSVTAAFQVIDQLYDKRR